MVSAKAVRLLLAPALALVLAACGGDAEPPGAEGPAPDPVLERLEALEQRIDGLEERLGGVERRLGGSPEQARSAAPGPTPGRVSASGAAPGPAVDRIAYVGGDGNVYTVQPNGDDRAQHTGVGGNLDSGPGNQLAFWPTWSPDGRSLAYSVARRAVEGTGLSIALMTVELSTGEKQELYSNPRVPVPIIADGTPHYMSWSPDSNRLAFLAMEAEGMALRVGSLDAPGETQRLALGAPLYHAWSADSSRLLLHAGGQLSLVRSPAFQDFLALSNEGSLAFRAPAWSPDGLRVLSVSEGPSGRNTLVSSDPEGDRAQALAPVGGQVAFLWSPTGEHIAFADAPTPGQPFFTRLNVTTPGGDEAAALEGEAILAFFWSPDGQRIAYVALSQERRPSMSWRVVDIADGEPRTLVEFVPGELFKVLLAYFDQYAYSHSLWSPDSTRILFVGSVPEGAKGSAGADAAEEETIYTLNVVGEPVLVPVAQGPIAAWSWS